MTITTTVNKINAPGDGIQTNFPYNFKVDDADHMLVYLDNVLYGAAYTVNGVGAPGGGSVDIPVPPGIGVIVTLYRSVPDSQKTDYEPYRSFPSETVENDMDLAAMRDQQLQEQSDRTVKAPVDDDGSFDYTLPAVAANKGIKANAAGNGFIETTYDPDEAQTDSAANVVLTNADVVSTNADVVLADAAALAAAASADEAAASAASIALKFKVIDIGDWDMDATTNVSVAHGLTQANIRSVQCTIRNDSATLLKDLGAGSNDTTTTPNGFIGSIGGTSIALFRLTGGAWDNTSYDLTSYNRGWVTIGYVD